MVIHKLSLYVYLTTYALRHEDVLGSGCTDPHFIDLGISWRRMVSFPPLLFYHRGKSPCYSLEGRLGGPLGQSGRHREMHILDTS
jgi:hypothetical protein